MKPEGTSGSVSSGPLTRDFLLQSQGLSFKNVAPECHSLVQCSVIGRKYCVDPARMVYDLVCVLGPFQVGEKVFPIWR